MSEAIVQYKLKAESAEKTEKIIHAVFTKLAKTRPQGIRYSSYKLEDGLTFVHHAVASPHNGVNLLQHLEAFMAFVRAIKERCEKPPRAMSASEIGSYQG